VKARRASNARRLKKPDGEVDFFFMDQGCRGSRSAEAGFTSVDANWYAHASQRSTIDRSIESWAYDTRLALLVTEHTLPGSATPATAMSNHRLLASAAASGERAESDGASG
jgi:hypothetical protein